MMFLDVFILGILVAFFVLFLNYCIGKPGSDKFSPHEIFSFYTVWLSKRRLKQIGLYAQYAIQERDDMERSKSLPNDIQVKNDYKKIYYETAEPFFTWERAAGMCPICFGVWVALICWHLYLFLFNYRAFNLAAHFVFLIIVIIISHVLIRLLTKII